MADKSLRNRLQPDDPVLSKNAGVRWFWTNPKDDIICCRRKRPKVSCLQENFWALDAQKREEGANHAVN